MNKLISVALMAFFMPSVLAATPKFKGFADDFNSADKYRAEWSNYGGAPASIEHVVTEDGDGFIKISSLEKTAAGVKHTVTGLKPGSVYRLSAKVKTENVEEGRGAVMYLEPGSAPDQPWNASEFVYGTNDWQDVYMDFVSSPTGTVDVVIALGFPWGTYNGGKSKGTAFWDDVKITEIPKGVFKEIAGKHIRILFDSDKVSETDKSLKAWVSELDKMYESYSQLVGGVPFKGRRIDIITTPGIEAGYWALAGNPILLNNHSDIKGIVEKYVKSKDICFGVTHEIGHTFNAGSMDKNYVWNWNDELFANFRMSYGIDQLGKTVGQDKNYTGAEIIDFYKKDYDKTLGAGKASASGDALHYTLLRIKEKYGWGIFEQAFRKLYAKERTDKDDSLTNYDKFNMLLDYLSTEAGEDVRTTYTTEELNLIKRGFEE